MQTHDPDFDIVAKFLPELKEAADSLAIIDDQLGRRFIDTVMEQKAFKCYMIVKNSLVDGIAQSRFGDHDRVKSFGVSLLLTGENTKANEFETLVRIFGATVPPDELIRRFEQHYQVQIEEAIKTEVVPPAAPADVKSPKPINLGVIETSIFDRFRTNSKEINSDINPSSQVGSISQDRQFTKEISSSPTQKSMLDFIIQKYSNFNEYASSLLSGSKKISSSNLNEISAHIISQPFRSQFLEKLSYLKAESAFPKILSNKKKLVFGGGSMLIVVMCWFASVTFLSSVAPKDLLFKKGVMWSSKQAQSGKCTDIVRQSKQTFAEAFSGFSREKVTTYFAFTNSTQQMFRSEPENMNKHLSFPANYVFNKDAVALTYDNGNFSTTSSYKIDTSGKTITRTDIQCLGNNPACEKGISLSKMQLEQEKKTNSVQPLYACVDDLPNRDMFGGSPIDRLKNGEGDAFYEAFVCTGSFQQEVVGREFATSLIKHLKDENTSEYNAQLSKSKKMFASSEIFGQKIENGCSKLELTKSSIPNGSRILIDKNDKLDFVIYRTSGSAAYSFTGVVERRK